MTDTQIGADAVAIVEAARNGILDARTTELTRLILTLPPERVGRVLLAVAFVAGNMAVRTDQETRQTIYAGAQRAYEAGPAK